MKKNIFLSTSRATMILLMLALITSVFFLSCKKEGNDKTENLCPVVTAAAVPLPVKDSFAVRYPATLVTTWFYKDSSSYCAAFMVAAIEKLAQFAPNGTFFKEEIETHQEGKNEDSTGTGGKITTGCECETHKEHD